jgi:hypothetical protein
MTTLPAPFFPGAPLHAGERNVASLREYFTKG